MQRWMCRGLELDLLALHSGESDSLLEANIAEPAAQDSLEWVRPVIDQVSFDCDVGAGNVRQRKRRRSKGIFDCDGIRDRDKDITPDACVASADRRNPVPADRGMIGRIVGAESAAIFAG